MQLGNVTEEEEVVALGIEGSPVIQFTGIHVSLLLITCMSVLQ